MLNISRMPTSNRSRGWWSWPPLLAGLLMAAAAQATGTGVQGEPGRDASLDVLIDAITEIHGQRTQLLGGEALPEDPTPAGSMEELLPLATGSAVERSAEFLGRVGRHGMAMDVDLARRIEAVVPGWLVAPQTLVSAQQTARAHLLVDELQKVLAESAARQYALQAHIATQIDAIWRDEPSHAEFVAGFTKGRAKIQPIVDELQANRRRLVRAFRDLLEFADSRRDAMAWDEDAGRLTMEADEDVIVYNRLVGKLQKASAQEEAIGALLMAEMGASVERLQQAD